MVIIETPIFTRQINRLMDVEQYLRCQNILITKPDAGNLIQGSAGIRKIRFSSQSKGKRGGIRLIYYWAKRKDQIYMLFAFSKNESSDLTKDQLFRLRKIVQEEFTNEE